MNIPVCFLYECFSFDSKVGVLTWKRRPESHFQGSEVTMKRWNGKNADKAAGTSRKDGRVAVCLNYYGKTHMIYASRIIFAMINGKWPDGLVDHLDWNPGNNKLENLRVCNKSQNSQNRLAPLGKLLPGVKKDGNRFSAKVKSNGVFYHVGMFRTEQEAHAAYVEKRDLLHGEFSIGNRNCIT